jgi:hypothetical protein
MALRLLLENPSNWKVGQLPIAGDRNGRSKSDTVKPVLNGPFIKGNFVLNGNIFRSRDYHCVLYCTVLCVGFCLNVLLLCEMCVTCLLGPIVVRLPPG